MGDTKVETISRLAQWRIENFRPCSFKKSDPFKVGIWNWHLSIERNRYLSVKLFPELSRVSKEQPPVAKFILRVSNVGPNRKFYISPVFEKLLRTPDDCVWHVDCSFHDRFTIDVEFLDLKTYPLNGGEASSVWPTDATMQSISIQTTLKCLSRMLEESILSDVIIHTADGTLSAHKAILSASSTVFKSMFHHDLKEKESSTIHIDDMSRESCMALLCYLCRLITQEDFWTPLLALLGAANKYDITDLTAAFEESLMEDINSGNVLEKLQEAWLYQLEKLKKGCLMYLFDFGKIYDVREEISSLLRQADRELMLEMFPEVLSVWKPV
ncbi:BTB/POZ domain-containing protein [Cardamine amara subsp. amara]|uniref:BTB/POZ domain-containing protein n=1 Tax=Cardamine amara subsp. amara TaxID=228776 RepID=A0ABD1B7Y7_CARAN